AGANGASACRRILPLDRFEQPCQRTRLRMSVIVPAVNAQSPQLKTAVLQSSNLLLRKQEKQFTEAIIFGDMIERRQTIPAVDRIDDGHGVCCEFAHAC